MEVDIFNKTGNKIATMKGRYVGLKENYIIKQSDEKEIFLQFEDVPEVRPKKTYRKVTNAITIIIDGKEVIQVGNTIIATDERIKKFDIDNNNIADSVKIKQLLGTRRAIIIYSQSGSLIAAYGGKYISYKVYLGKTSQFDVDGLCLFIHRANYILI